MPDSRHDQVIEFLLRQILSELQKLRREVNEIEADVDELEPTPQAKSATLIVTKD